MQAETKRSIREVTVQLDDLEIVTLAKKAGEVRTKKSALESEFGRVKNAYKGRIEELESEITKILTAVQEGQETRTAEVEETYNFHTNSVIMCDSKTGRILDTRAMTVEERQMSLGFKGPAQGSLGLSLDTPTPAPVELNAVETVTLPDPTSKEQEPIFVPGSPDKATIVLHGAKSWRLEPGEAASFRVAEEEIFGNPTLVYDKASALDVAQPEPEEDEDEPEEDEDEAAPE